MGTVKRVLVVNDSRFERKIMRDMLINLGYEVETTDEFTALSLLDSYNPDIIIANMNMTNITGDMLIQNIKERRPTTKCYLSSCSEISPEYSQRKWIDGVFSTPINPGSLAVILQKEEIEEPKPLEEIKELVANCRLPDNLHDENEVPRFTFCPYCGNKLNATSGTCTNKSCGHKHKM